MRCLFLGILAVLTAGAVSRAHAQPANAEAIALKQTLVGAGFDCKGSEFVTCLSPPGRDVAGYPQPIAVIIPPRFHPGGRLVLHQHGWLKDLPTDRSPQRILNSFKFHQLIKDSGVHDTLFVLPFSQGRCDTYKESVAPAFEKFMGSVFDLLKVPAPSAITISGHSGAWTPMEEILENAFKDDAEVRLYGLRIDSAFLFDATYSGDLPIIGGANPFEDETAGFKALGRAVADKPQPRVSAVYRKATFTELGAKRMKREIGTVFRTLERPRNSDHWGTVQAGFSTFLRELKD